MKKIINGKKYDTETADMICVKEWFDKTVSKHFIEYFYLKKTGEFFRYDDKWTTWGDIHSYEKIIPLDVDRAKKELEDILTIERYENYFGPVEE